MNGFLVFQSDFGLVDGAVSAMEGVAYEVDSNLKLCNLTHEITPYNIFEASYRLFQTVEYWKEGTVFVSVVDPGVGTNRKSVVALTNSNHYIVTPDNGSLTHIAKFVGLKEVREINKNLYKKQAEYSYTFHGRDVYAYTGALIASNKIKFEDVGEIVDEITSLPLVEVEINENSVKGSIDILDVRFGSLWTNIKREDFMSLNPKYDEKFEVIITNNSNVVYQNKIVYGKSFADVRIGSAILYVNSLFRMGIAINQGSFAKAYNVGVGANWLVEIIRN